MMASLWSRGIGGLFGRRGTQAEIYKLLDELELKNQLLEFELHRTSKKANDLVQKEVEIIHMDDKLRKKEQTLKNISDTVLEKGKAAEAKLKFLEEKEEYLKTEEEKLDLEKQEISYEKERFLVLKDEVERMRDELNQKLLQIDDENEKLKVRKELLLKEEEDLKLGRNQFEEEIQKKIQYLSSGNRDNNAALNRKLKYQRGRFELAEIQRNEGFDLPIELDDECLENASPHGTIVGRYPTETDLNLSDQSGGGHHLSWLPNCTGGMFNSSTQKITTNHLLGLSFDDKKASRKRTRADQSSSMTEAEARKKRQTVAPSQDPGQQFASYKHLTRQPEDGLAFDLNADSEDFEIVDFSVKVINDKPEDNGEHAETQLTRQPKDGLAFDLNADSEDFEIVDCSEKFINDKREGNGEEDDHDDEDNDEDGDDDSRGMAMGRKIWKFLIT